MSESEIILIRDLGFSTKQHELDSFKWDGILYSPTRLVPAGILTPT
jgi:hypothetical protein